MVMKWPRVLLAAEPKGKRMNPIKRQQMEDRLHEIEEEIARAEAAIAACETELQSFVSAEETQRQTLELANQKSALQRPDGGVGRAVWGSGNGGLDYAPLPKATRDLSRKTSEHSQGTQGRGPNSLSLCACVPFHLLTVPLSSRRRRASDRFGAPHTDFHVNARPQAADD